VTQNKPYEFLIAKLSTRHALDEADEAAIRRLSSVLRTVRAGTYLVREGERPTTCALMLDGFASRHKSESTGSRQILGLIVPGDFTDVQQFVLRQADHCVQTLTEVTMADVPVAELEELAVGRPNVGRALWIDTLVQASITREALLNVARRDAASRVAHLLCELVVRLAIAHRAEPGFELPMTQEQLADATGLTPVHVNRTLRMLEEQGFIARRLRAIQIVEWQRLKQLADFRPGYLHADLIRPGSEPLSPAANEQGRRSTASPARPGL